MRAGRALREMVIARIKDQVTDFNGQVYDRAIKRSTFPYCALGPSSWVDDSAGCIKARSQTLQIDIFTTGNKGLCEDLTDDVAGALDDWGDDDALAMHPLRVILVRVINDPDPEIAHGIVQIEAMVESDVA